MRAGFELLRRERDFRRVYLASLVSMTGDWFALVPLVTLLAELTGGGLYGGLTLAVDTLLFALVSPYGGLVADRVDRRRVLVATEAVSAVAVLLLLGVADRGSAWLAVVSIAVVAAAKGLYGPASSAALPNLVDPADLPTANVLVGTAWGTMLAVGAAASGLLAAATSPRVCFLVDAVSFAVSAGLIALTRRPMQQPRTGPPGSLRSDLATAWRFGRGNAPVRALLFAKPGVGLGNGTLVLFPLYATQLFGVGAVGTGLLYAGRGLGALAWPLIVRPGLRRPGVLPVVCGASMALFAAGYLGMAAAPVFGLSLAFVVLAHLGGGANWTMSGYGLQVLVPDDVRGRVFSADWTLATLAIGASQVAAGVLSGHVPLRWLTAGFALVTAGYTVTWYLAARRAGFAHARALGAAVPGALPAEVP